MNDESIESPTQFETESGHSPVPLSPISGSTPIWLNTRGSVSLRSPALGNSQAEAEALSKKFCEAWEEITNLVVENHG